MTKNKRIYLLVLVSILTIISTCLAMCFIDKQELSAEEIKVDDYALAYSNYTIKDYTQSTIVKDSRGNIVEVTEGSFMPKSEGYYYIINGQNRFVLQVFNKVPTSTFSYDYYLEKEYGTNEIIKLPKAKIISSIVNNPDYLINVIFNTTLLETINPKNTTSFLPTDEGSYIFEYYYIDYFGYTVTNEVKFYVVNKPIISFAAPEKLSYGSICNIEHASAYFGSKAYNVELKIISPLGKDVDISSGSFKVDEIGEWKYYLESIIEGKKITKTYSIESNLYTTDLFEATRLANEPISDVATPEYSKNKTKGVLLEATTSNAVFTFKNTIDLNNVTRDMNLLTFIPYVTNTVGYVEDLNITLTDIYDSKNSVGIQFKHSPFHPNYTYVTAWNNGRHYAYDNENFVLTGINGPVKIGDQFFFGGIMRNLYSMDGRAKNAEMFSFTLDYANRDMVLDLTPVGEGRYTLMDYDNAIWCGGDKFVWDGFTTGEVYMTINFGNVVGNSAAILVTEVLGQELTGNLVNDETSPELLIDIDSDYIDNMPYGVVNKKYSLPSAVAYDFICGETDVNLDVLYKGDLITTEDGYFIPTKDGQYTLKYTSKDVNGNSVSKELYVRVYNEAPNLEISVSDYQTPLTGKYFEIPSINVENASGKIVVNQTIVYNNKKITPDNFNKIYIDKVGDIQILVDVTDWLGQKKSKTFTIKVDDNKLRINVKEQFGTIQKGRTIKFVDAEIYDFVGKEDSTVSQEISVNGTILTNNTYTVKTTDEVLKVKYVVKCNEQTVEYSYSIVVYNDVASAFETNGNYVVGGSGNDEVHFNFNGNGYFALRNAVSQNNLKISLQTPIANFSYMDIVLTDSANSDETVFIRVYDYSTSQVKLQLNGEGDFYLLSGSIRENIPFTFFYECDRKVLKTTLTDQIIFSLTKTSFGDKFDGFTSGAIYFRVNVVGVTNTTDIRLVSISNETFIANLRTNKDLNAPIVSYSTDKEYVENEYNTEYTLIPTYAYDVLLGRFNVKASVIDPSGNVILDNQELTSEYKFITNQYGTYKVIYSTYENAYTKLGSKELFINVLDKTLPTITINGTMFDTCKVGDSLTILSATATDNLSNNLKVKILIYEPTYFNFVVKSGDKYTFTKKGTYKIVYTTCDEQGNVTKVIHTIVCE